MIFEHKTPKREMIRETLKEKVDMAIQHTNYSLSRLDFDAKNFGNVIVEITDQTTTYRIIYDRGDIYIEQKLNNSQFWSDQKLVAVHDEVASNNYDTLIISIKEMVQ